MQNRPIRFRAWDKEKKEMLFLTFFGPKPVWVVDGSDFMDISELMQFTGLLDKNGREIYEADIVQLADDNAFEDEKELVAKVIWDVDGWFLESGEILHPRDWSMYEIIGNVYEHKHLLSDNGVQQKSTD